MSRLGLLSSFFDRRVWNNLRKVPQITNILLVLRRRLHRLRDRRLILNLRLTEGARYETFEKRYKLDVRSLLRTAFTAEELERFFLFRADSVSLNAEGLFLSDEIFRRIV